MSILPHECLPLRTTDRRRAPALSFSLLAAASTSAIYTLNTLTQCWKRAPEPVVISCREEAPLAFPDAASYFFVCRCPVDVKWVGPVQHDVQQNAHRKHIRLCTSYIPSVGETLWGPVGRGADLCGIWCSGFQGCAEPRSTRVAGLLGRCSSMIFSGFTHRALCTCVVEKVKRVGGVEEARSISL